MTVDLSMLVAQTPLNTDFGHSPVAFAGRGVQPGVPAAPRTVGQGIRDFGDSVRRLGLRLFNFVSPMHVRANDKFRGALADTSQRVGELFGALSDPAAVNTGAIKKGLAAVDQAMKPLIGYRANAEDVVAERMKVSLTHKDMTVERLIALSRGVAQARERGDLKSNEHLTAIEAAVGAEIAARIKRASHGEPRNRLIKEALCHSAISGETKPEELGTLGKVLSEMSVEKLRDLLNTRGQGGEGTAAADKFAAADALIDRQITERLKMAKVDFMVAADKLLNRSKEDPSGELTEDLAAAVQSLDGLRKQVAFVGRLPGVKVDPEVDEKLGKVSTKLSRLEELLTSDNLTLAELEQIQGHLAALGVPEGENKLKTELDTRKVELGRRHQDEYARALIEACNAATSGDTNALLRCLGEVKQKGEEAILALQNIDGREYDINDQYNFAKEFNSGALKRLDMEKLEELYGKLNGKRMSALVDNLTTIGTKLISKARATTEDLQLGQHMLSIGITLGRVREAAHDLLDNPVLIDDADYEPKDMDASDHKALGDVLGVKVAKSGEVQKLAELAGNAKAEFKAAIEAQLGRIDKDNQSFRVTRHGYKVSEDMWLGLGKVQVSIQSQDGAKELLKAKSAEELDKCAGELGRLVGNDEEMLTLVSKFIGSATLDATVTATRHSPIRLPDGTAGAMFSLEKNDRIDIRSDGNGGVILACSRSAEKGKFFSKPNGTLAQQVDLDPEASRYQFDFEIRIGKDKKLEVSSPVHYSYDIGLAPAVH